MVDGNNPVEGSNPFQAAGQEQPATEAAQDDILNTTSSASPDKVSPDNVVEFSLATAAAPDVDLNQSFDLKTLNHGNSFGDTVEAAKGFAYEVNVKNFGSMRFSEEFDAPLSGAEQALFDEVIWPQVKAGVIASIGQEMQTFRAAEEADEMQEVGGLIASHTVQPLPIEVFAAARDSMIEELSRRADLKPGDKRIDERLHASLGIAA